ncbi:hypothetical protein QQP08_008021 [Theobroma cacao]|nr:hypothetical protein QQP08_008021 [Theobroma cacao]
MKILEGSTFPAEKETGVKYFIGLKDRVFSYTDPKRMLITAAITSPPFAFLEVTAIAPIQMIKAQAQKVPPITRIIGATTNISRETSQQHMAAIKIAEKNVAKLERKWPNWESEVKLAICQHFEESYKARNVNLSRAICLSLAYIQHPISAKLKSIRIYGAVQGSSRQLQDHVVSSSSVIDKEGAIAPFFLNTM